MLEKLSGYCPSTANLNPLNWSAATQKKALLATGAVIIGGIALYALSSIPGAEAISYNNLRALQVATEQGLEAGAERAMIGNTFGNFAGDLYSNGLSGAVWGHAYEKCMNTCSGFLECLACQVLKP